MIKRPLIGQSMKELKTLVQSYNHRPFRGEQLYDWLYKKRIYKCEEMSDLPLKLRKQLLDTPVHPLEIVKSEDSRSKKTKKFLFKLKGDQKIESVLIRDGRRVTVCISTQVGCAVNCDFCATAKMGFIQNLSQGEIVDQFMQLEKICDVKITNVVFMGMGEPFLNYKNTCIFVEMNASLIELTRQKLSNAKKYRFMYHAWLPLVYQNQKSKIHSMLYMHQNLFFAFKNCIVN